MKNKSRFWLNNTNLMMLLLVNTMLLTSCAGVSSATNETSPDVQTVPKFSALNKCEALAAWVRPLQSEFPNVKFRRETEIKVKDKYVLLFSDDNFVPVFGKSIDALSGRQLKSIGKTLTNIRRKCKGHQSPDVQYLLSLGGTFLSRPFNLKLKRTPLSYQFVVDHARARRAALAPLGLKTGEKPSAEQLIQIASPGKPIFHLLWPTERGEIATYDQTRPSSARFKGELGTDQPQGQWVGLGYCRRKYEKMTVDIQMLPGRIAGKLRSYRIIRFEMIPSGGGVYEIRSDSSVFKDKATIRRIKDLPAVLSMQVAGGGCSRVVAIRFQPIKGLGGRYAGVTDQKSFCSDIVDRWTGVASNRLQTETWLKEIFYPVLNGYNARKASNAALFSDAVITDFFGMPASQIGSEQLSALNRQIAGCDVMRPTDSGNRTGFNFYTPGSIVTARKQIFQSPPYESVTLQLSTVFDRFISGESGNQSSSESLSALLSGWENQNSVSALEGFVRKRAQRLGEYDPDEVKQALLSIADQLRSARREGHQRTNAVKMAKYQKLLKSADIPYNKLEVPFRNVLESMANGKPVQMDASTQLFFGGLAGHYLKECKHSLSTSERMPVAQFVGSSTQRAAMGANYSDSNIGKAMGERVTGQGIFVGGQNTAQIIGCNAANPMLRLVGDMVKSNSMDDEGRAPLFIRSCAPELGHAKCKCLAKVGNAVMSNINQKRYTRNIVPSIISRDPIVGAQIIGVCGIVSY